MKIEDGFIKLDEGEYCKIFDYIDRKVEYPNYIEKIIMETFIEKSGLKIDIENKDIDDVFSEIPADFLDDVIDNIDQMYMNHGKLDYSNLYISYLLYYLPCNTYKIQRALSDLIIKGNLKAKIKVFDIGTGPASIPIGIIDYYIHLAKANKSLKFSIDLIILDAEKNFLDIAGTMIIKIKKLLPGNLDVNLLRKIKKKIDKHTDFSGRYDIICMSNLLNMFEVEGDLNKEALIKKVKAIMEDDGSLIIIEPGDNEDCTDFKLLRNEIVNNRILNIYSPCVSLWNKKKKYSCSCFSCAKVLWIKPRIIEQLIRYGLSKHRDDVPYNYIIFRKDEKRKYEIMGMTSKYTKLKDLKYQNNKRLNVCGFVRYFNETYSRYYISICDGSREMTESSGVSLEIKKDNTNIYNKYKDLLKSMNMGQKIAATNVIYDKPIKYPESVFLLVDDETRLKFYY